MEFRTIGSTTPAHERGWFDFPRGTAGVTLALQDGRIITIGDMGHGPVIEVIGPDDETLALWPMPTVERGTPCTTPDCASYAGHPGMHFAEPQEREQSAFSAPPAEDTIWCRLRGTNVPVAECVASCPAPEQRDVCAFEFDPTTTPQLARYQAEGR